MSDENKKSAQELFVSPPVIGAIITSTVAVLLTVIPIVLSNRNNTPPTPVSPTNTPTEQVAESIPLSPSHTAVEAQAVNPTEPAILPSPTELPRSATPNPPTATPVPPTDTPPPPANVILLQDDASFTFYNQSGGMLDISNISFRSSNGSWDALNWGPSLAANLPDDNCLRVRDITTGERQAPQICGSLFGFQLVGASALFWLNVDSYEVLSDGQVIAVCQTSAETCPVFIE